MNVIILVIIIGKYRWNPVLYLMRSVLNIVFILSFSVHCRVIWPEQERSHDESADAWRLRYVLTPPITALPIGGRGFFNHDPQEWRYPQTKDRRNARRGSATLVSLGSIRHSVRLFIPLFFVHACMIVPICRGAGRRWSLGYADKAVAIISLACLYLEQLHWGFYAITLYTMAL